MEDGRLISAERLRGDFARVRRAMGWCGGLLVAAGLVVMGRMLMVFVELAAYGDVGGVPGWVVEGVVGAFFVGSGVVMAAMVWANWKVARCPVCGARLEGTVRVGRTGRCARCHEVIAERVELGMAMRPAGMRLVVGVMAAAMGMTVLAGGIAMHGWKLEGMSVGEFVGWVWGIAGAVAVMFTPVVWGEGRAKRGRAAEMEPQGAVLRVVEMRRVWPREYAMFLAPGGLCFARVPGVVDTRRWGSEEPKWRRAMGKYGGMAMPSEEFLGADGGNFYVGREEVEGFSYRPFYELSWRERWRNESGLAVRMRGGEVRWFRVMTELSGREILGMMRGWMGAG
ncbi:MAG TPA: hypothetical protein VH253_18190 [Phycisphaerae bacterium]|nr:hypothetical protein [Phycisphaerae bacterium]